MKRRHREVNIFSVSLLDILSGALGAFCFMTIVLMPYYKPDAASAQDTQAQQQELQKQIERLKAALANSPDGRELQRRLEEIQRRMQQLQGQMNQQSRELQQTRKEREALRDRNPVVISMAWDQPYANIDLYPRALPENDPSKGAAPVDPAKFQSTRFKGDALLSCGRGPCYEMALLRDNPPGWAIEVYYKYFNATGTGGAASAGGYFQHEGRSWPLPIVRLERPGTAVQVGKIRIKPDRGVEFVPASEFAESYRKTLEAWNRPRN